MRPPVPASTSTCHQDLIRRMVVPRAGQQRVACRKTYDKGAKRTQIFAMGCSTPRLALG